MRSSFWYFKVPVLLAVVVIVGFFGGRASASYLQYEVFPGLTNGFGSLDEYGMHFDESSYPDFGARDWNHTGDGGAAAYFRIRLARTQPSGGLVMRFTHFGSCGVTAEIGYKDGGGVWHAYSGEVFHYLHMTNRIANNTYSTAINSTGITYAWQVGTVASSGGCVYGDPHLHHSADLGAASPIYRQVPYQDTCWKDGTAGSWCWDSYRDHLTCTSWSGYASKSGTFSEYVCQTWGLNAWYYSTRVFQITK